MHWLQTGLVRWVLSRVGATPVDPVGFEWWQRGRADEPAGSWGGRVEEVALLGRGVDRAVLRATVDEHLKFCMRRQSLVVTRFVFSCCQQWLAVHGRREASESDLVGGRIPDFI